MHAVLVTMGTHGDVAPYLGLGERLRARGHRVTLAANEPYAPAAAELGLEFLPLISTVDINRLLGDPDFWHPIKGPAVGVRYGGPLIPAQYAMLAGLAREPDVVLVSNPGVFAARIAHDKFGCPLATIILQPWMIASAIAPPAMSGGLSLPAGAPRWVGRLYWRLFDVIVDGLIRRRINRFRREQQLGPVSRIPQWMLSPQLMLGMFPDWYGPPQADWSPQLRLTGFPMYDGTGARGLPSEIVKFCRAAAPPVVFTAGTGMLHAAEFFRSAVEACDQLGLRGVLLTGHDAQVPAKLPANVRHFEFAPFLELFPLCGAVVHHGGIGTTARALAAGIPQVLLPQAWDQCDNARRIEKIGAGIGLPRRRRRGRDLAAALERVLSPPTVERCRQVAGQIGEDDGLDSAADRIEELARQHGR